MRGDDVTAVESHYLLMGLDGKSELRLVNSNACVRGLVQGAILAAWPPGLDCAEQYMLPGSFMFRMREKPWKCTGQRLIEAHLMLIRLLDDFSANGYRVVATLSMGTILVDKSTFILRSVPDSLQVPEQHIAIINEESGTMKLVKFPKDLVKRVRQCIQVYWPEELGVKKMGWSFCDSFEIIFGAALYEWSTPCGAWFLLVAIISVIEKEGWRLMSCANVSARTFDESNGDTSDSFREMSSTFFFARPANDARAPSVLPSYHQVSSGYRGSSLPSYSELDL